MLDRALQRILSVMVMTFLASDCGSHRSVRLSRAVQKIPEQRVAVLGQDRFRVELYALDGVLAVAHAHDLAVVGASR